MEREVQLMEGRPQAWPLHMMGMAPAGPTTSCFDDYSSSSSGDGFVLGWEQLAAPPFGCFGLLAADVHDLFPLFAAGMEPPALPAPPPSANDVAAAIPGELDDLLLNFWDASCHDGDVGEPLKAQQPQKQAAFNSSCVTHEQDYCTPTTNSFLHYDDDGDDPLSSIFSAGPAPALAAERAVFQQQAPAAEAEHLPSSSSSNCRGDPRAGGVDLQLQLEGQGQGQGAAWARTPPLPRRTSTSAPSLKRATREESSSEQAAAAECSSQSDGGSNKRRKAAAAAGVVCPFALLKPDGLDGGATLADINARILMRPARPVRHPVGEFACAPRVSADQPGISGKAVASFTRLHTPGRGTITIIRTREAS
ncbi:unnamed protein product [Miscanthus lutarioriparius]|uniref:Uncharacterized protein n=1 Tax=Miscanthus lutarioriparius TaxID=422564 RepID=A0A811NM23_9POAL|nr:unnamed protein product [Miscanthus lutarioriparius]